MTSFRAAVRRSTYRRNDSTRSRSRSRSVSRSKSVSSPRRRPSRRERSSLSRQLSFPLTDHFSHFSVEQLPDTVIEDENVEVPILLKNCV